MLAKFYPHHYLNSVFDIDYSALWEQGFRGLIFDIDQTLVNHGEPATPEVEKLFQKIQNLGFKVIFLSNNSQERITEFTQNMDIPFVHLADKPKTTGFEKAITQLGLERQQIVMIGDQVFTDILGANRVGLTSILVRFIRREHEVKIGKKRRLEQLILLTYRWRKNYYNRLGKISKGEI